MTTGAEPRVTASERLEQSRVRLHQAMRGTSSAAGAASEAGVAGPTTLWLDILKSNPAVRTVFTALSAWWAQHPLQVAGTAAVATARAAVQPLADRHPFGLLLGALILGGLLAWSRPWRWALRPALLAGLLPQLLSQALAQAPIQSWLAAFAAPTLQPPAARSD